MTWSMMMSGSQNPSPSSDQSHSLFWTITKQSSATILATEESSQKTLGEERVGDNQSHCWTRVTWGWSPGWSAASARWPPRCSSDSPCPWCQEGHQKDWEEDWSSRARVKRFYLGGKSLFHLKLSIPATRPRMRTSAKISRTRKEVIARRLFSLPIRKILWKNNRFLWENYEYFCMCYIHISSKFPWPISLFLYPFYK